MDPVLLNFLLQNIGFPVVMQIINARKAASQLSTVTSEQVISDYAADTAKWISQGQQWLAAQVPPVKVGP